MKTVKEVSKITGISIRALRYYDEMGLLKPSQISSAGYRLYDNKSLEKLQEIMFYRELEIPLQAIKKIMDNPNYDKKQALLSQLALLEHKRNRLNGIIELIKDVLEGVNTMSFEAFNEQDIKKMIETIKSDLSEEEFQAFIKEYGGGNVEKYEEILLKSLTDEKVSSDILRWYRSKENFIKASKPQHNTEQTKNDIHEIYLRFASLMNSPDIESEQLLVERLANSYKNMLKLDNPRAFLLDFAKEIQNEKLADIHDTQYGKGSSKYMAEAIQRYYGV